MGPKPLKMSAGRSVLPISWKSVGGPPLFPELEGQLEVEEIGKDRTLVTLSASYQPPMGELGAAVDRAILHRLADATMKDFVDRVAQRLEAALASPS